MKSLPGILILSSIGLATLTGCDRNRYYDTMGLNGNVMGSYGRPSSFAQVLSNWGEYKWFQHSEEDRREHEEAVFFTLEMGDIGETTSWYNEENNTSGHVRTIMTYPQGSGFCKIIQSNIRRGNKSNDYTETACIEYGQETWRFVRK